MSQTNRFRLLLVFEFHEIITLIMIIGISLLYALKLNMNVLYVLSIVGLITKMFFILLVGLAVIYLCLPNRPIKKIAKFVLRIMSSFFSMLLIFEFITNYIRFRGLTLKDEMLQQWDYFLFQGKLAPVWLEPLHSTVITMILSGAYLTWFILTYSTVFLLLLKGRETVLEYTANALLTFYVGYVIYIFVPALGPLYSYPFSQAMGGLTTLLLNPLWINPAADVFPSLHTGISVVMLMQIWKSYRIWTWFYGPLCVLIIISTMYLRIHYGVDIIAGILLAVLMTKIGPNLMNFWNQLRRKETIEVSTDHFQA